MVVKWSSLVIGSSLTQGSSKRLLFLLYALLVKLFQFCIIIYKTLTDCILHSLAISTSWYFWSVCLSGYNSEADEASLITNSSICSLDAIEPETRWTSGWSSQTQVSDISPVVALILWLRWECHVHYLAGWLAAWGPPASQLACHPTQARWWHFPVLSIMDLPHIGLPFQMALVPMR